MFSHLGAARLLHCLYESLDILCAVLRRNQNCVTGFHNYLVPDADCRDEPAITVDDAVVSTLGDNVATADIPVTIRPSNRIERLPATHVIPTSIKRNHNRAA